MHLKNFHAKDVDAAVWLQPLWHSLRLKELIKSRILSSAMWISTRGEQTHIRWHSSILPSYTPLFQRDAFFVHQQGAF